MPAKPGRKDRDHELADYFAEAPDFDEEDYASTAEPDSDLESLADCSADDDVLDSAIAEHVTCARLGVGFPGRGPVGEVDLRVVCLRRFEPGLCRILQWAERDTGCPPPLTEGVGCRTAPPLSRPSAVAGAGCPRRRR